MSIQTWYCTIFRGWGVTVSCRSKPAQFLCLGFSTIVQGLTWDILQTSGYHSSEDSHCGLMGYNTLYRGNWSELVPDSSNIQNHRHNMKLFSVDKKNQLDVTFCILYFSSNSCSTCFGQPCAHHQEPTTAWCCSLVLVCAVAAGRLSSPIGW
jgi:hypothetical protein